MKKLSSLLLALILCLGVPVASAAESDFQIRDGVLVKYTGEDQFLTIPDSVTAIGEEAFVSCNTLNEVILPDSVTSIGWRAFAWSERLFSVVIPDTVTELADEAFYGCSSLKEVELPEGLTRIGKKLFATASMEELTIPASVTVIDEQAFNSCLDLNVVRIPKGVTTIGYGAFYNCTGLEEVYYEGTEEEWDRISIDSQNTCLLRAEIYFGANAVSKEEKEALPDTGGQCGDRVFWSYSNGVLTISGTGAMYDYSKPTPWVEKNYQDSIRTVVIEEGVTAIGEAAFMRCFSLTDLSIPASVTQIGTSAFRGCASLTAVAIPDTVTAIGNSLFYECAGLTEAVLPKHLTKIPRYTFGECTSLRKFDCPSTVTSIEEGAFMNCQEMEYISFPNGLRTIGDYAFRWCTDLKEVRFPDGLTYIGKLSFHDCDHLTSLVLPDSVTTIIQGAFANCDRLTSITLPRNLKVIDGFGVLPITEVEFPQEAETIADSAFWASNQLKRVVIPNSVKVIGPDAFKSCVSLSELTIGNRVETIGRWAFAYCALQEVILPDSVTFIGDYSFAYCDELTHVKLSQSLSCIEEAAFIRCTGLTSIEIPRSMTEIKSKAFSDCDALTDIYYGGSQEEWKAISVGAENDALRNATLHYNCAFEQETAPTVPDFATEQEAIAYASTQSITLDGKSVELQAYALKDEKGYLTNYVKLRDIAYLLNGSKAQFDVTWDGAVNILSGRAYQPNGGEMKTPYSGDRPYETVAADSTKFNGEVCDLTAILLTHESGGYTYYKLRDLGQVLGFYVGWEDGIIVDSSRAYQ